MRALFCLFALFLVLPAVFATSAVAEIKPIPRPAAKAKAKPATSAAGSSVTPLARPLVRASKPAVRAKKPAARAKARVARVVARAPRASARVSSTRRLRAATTTRAKRPARVLVRSRGGRSAPPSLSHGGHIPPPLPIAPVAPDPTPLGLVAIGEVLPSEGDAWPAWMLSLLGVLALSEAFLLLHIVRERVFAEV